MGNNRTPQRRKASNTIEQGLQIQHRVRQIQKGRGLQIQGRRLQSSWKRGRRSIANKMGRGEKLSVSKLQLADEPLVVVRSSLCSHHKASSRPHPYNMHFSSSSYRLELDSHNNHKNSCVFWQLAEEIGRSSVKDKGASAVTGRQGKGFRWNFRALKIWRL